MDSIIDRRDEFLKRSLKRLDRPLGRSVINRMNCLAGTLTAGVPAPNVGWACQCHRGWLG
jgi:hypothetical protein